MQTVGGIFTFLYFSVRVKSGFVFPILRSLSRRWWFSVIGDTRGAGGGTVV